MKPGKLQRSMYCYGFFAWSRGSDPAQSNATTVVFQSKREVYRDYFCLKKFDVTSICLKTIPGQ